MAIALVTGQHLKTANGGVSSLPQAFPSNVTAGNLLILVQTLWLTGGTITGVTDSQSNTWTAATTLANGDSVPISGANPRVQIWYAIAGSSAACTVTPAFSGSCTYSTGVILEFSGCATASPQDGSGVAVNNGNVNTGATPTILSTTLTTGSANSLLIGGIVCNNDIGPGTGFTAPESSASWAYDRAIYKLDAGAAGSQTVAFNDSVGLNDGYAIVAAAFKINAGVATTNYYPGSDITTSGWTSSLGGALYAAIDETGPDDGDYDQSAINPSTDVMEVKFFNVQPPSANTNHTVSYRLKGDSSTNVTVSLVCNTTIIKTWTHTPAPASFTTYDQTLTTGEANTISDYSNLRLRVTAG